MVCSDSAHETYPWLRACDKTVTTLEYPDVTSAIACCWSRCGMEWCDEEVSSVQASGVEVVVGPPSFPRNSSPGSSASFNAAGGGGASKCQAAGAGAGRAGAGGMPEQQPSLPLCPLSLCEGVSGPNSQADLHQTYSCFTPDLLMTKLAFIDSISDLLKYIHNIKR